MIELLICVGVVVIPPLARTLIADVGFTASLCVYVWMFSMCMVALTDGGDLLV